MSLFNADLKLTVFPQTIAGAFIVLKESFCKEIKVLVAYYMTFVLLYDICTYCVAKHNTNFVGTEFPRLHALHVLNASARFNAGCRGRQTF